MRLLLDTHTLIWHVGKRVALSDDAAKAIENPANQIYVSAASFWEMAIKSSLGKLNLHRPIRDIIATYQVASATLLSVTPDHTLMIENLPWHHKDPFDRMLIAQAMHEDLVLISKDGQFEKYQVARIW